MTSNVKLLPIRTWNRIRNNGDAFTSIFADKILDLHPYHAAPTQPHLLGVGSILFMSNTNSHIWGSGVLNRGAHLPPIDAQKIHALRGELSVAHLRKNGVPVRDVPLGDPGIFADMILSKTDNFPPSARYRAAVIPHHNSIYHPFFNALRDREDICVVDIIDDGALPIHQIAAAEIVISQSLHGLIYAESLGKPSLWVATRSDDIWNFKFLDWFTTTSNPQSAPIMIDRPLGDMIGMAEPRLSTIDRTQLLDSFPNMIITESSARRVSYDACRQLSPITIFYQLPEGNTDSVAPSSADNLQFQTKILRQLVGKCASGWAERPYVMAMEISALAIPTPDQVKMIARCLDERSGVDFGYVIPKMNILPEGVKEIHLPMGVTLYIGCKNISNSFILRPTFESLTENYVVFGI